MHDPSLCKIRNNEKDVIKLIEIISCTFNESVIFEWYIQGILN